MTRYEVSLNVLSYWHAGSGAGHGGDIDAVVVRDDCRLPYLPGRTLKGLFRDACATAIDAGRLPSDAITRLFGDESGKKSRFDTKPGLLSFEDGILEERNYFALNSEAADFLTVPIASTAIEETTGTAQDKSLRVVEYAVPCTLVGAIHGPAQYRALSANGTEEERQTFADLSMMASLIRSFGSGRNRGFGRVAIEIREGR